MEYTLEEVERYQRMLEDAASRAKIKEILTEDPDLELAKFLSLGDEVLREVKDRAEVWWETHQDDPVPISYDLGLSGDELNTLDEKAYNDLLKQQRQLYLDSGKSAAYLHQLYDDAAKAQKRLSQIGSMTGTADGSVIARMPSIKGIARASEKLIKEYDRDASQLRDLARGTIEVKRLDKLKDAVTSFLAQAKASAPGAAVTRFKNKFKDPTPSGYSDLQMHIMLDGGHICEMQFQCTALLDFKEMGAYPGRAGHPGGGDTAATPGVEWADWSVLLGGTDQLTEVAETRAELEGIKDTIGAPPKDAQKSMAKFDGGKWLLNSHDTYNVSRWLKGLIDDDAIDGGVKDTLRAIMGKWDALSLAATEAVQAIITAQLQEATGSTDIDYASIKADLAAFKVKIGPL